MIKLRGQHRRGFLRTLCAGVLVPARVLAAGDPPRDQGIGGTGLAAAPPADGDRGIGGTGVVGTVRRFGSIFVNGLRVNYPEDVRVTIDGRPATLDDLRLGHVVAVAATGPRAKLVTREIAVSREVVGPVASIDGNTLSVLGQAVRVDGAAPKVSPGDWVAVSGLRRTDGSIAASLVETTTPGVARIAGPLVAQADGVAVGGFALSGTGAQLVGQRVLVEGSLKGADFALSSIAADRTVAALGPVRNVSIEAFVTRDSGGLRLGSGQSIKGDSGRAAEGRAVITARVAADGELRAERVAPASGGGVDRTGPQRAPAGDAPRLAPGGPPARPGVGSPSPGGGRPTGNVPTTPGGSGSLPTSGAGAGSTLRGGNTSVPSPVISHPGGLGGPTGLGRGGGQGGFGGGGGPGRR